MPPYMCITPRRCLKEIGAMFTSVVCIHVQCVCALVCTHVHVCVIQHCTTVQMICNVLGRRGGEGGGGGKGVLVLVNSSFQEGYPAVYAVALRACCKLLHAYVCTCTLLESE